MSFILDALKKSERERQKRIAPKMSNILVEQPKFTRPKWFILIISMLFLVICFLILSIFFPNSINIFNKEASIAIELPLETKIPPNLKFNDPELPKIEVISNDMPIINSSEIFNIDIANLKYNLSLPDLHIDIHVYSEVPNERFVFINMRKYKEGEVLIYGPNIQTITAEGVILNYKNINFLLAKN